MRIDLQAERKKLLRRVCEQDKKTGAALRLKRESRGLKSGWVATQMGISPSFLSDLERGMRHWKDYHISAFLKAIGETP